MSTVKRIKQFLEYKGITNQKFESEIGYSNGAFGSQLKNNKTIGSDKLENILNIYADINPEWLLSGKGTMLKDTEGLITVNEPNEPYRSINTKTQSIPLVSATAIGGLGNSVFAIGQKDVKDNYVIPKFQNKKVDFMIEVEGSSMYPKYNSGDVVACRIINDQTFIQWNKTHVIATKDQGIIIKRINPGADGLMMVSDNKEYPPFEVPKTEIDGIALVVGVIRLE